MNSPQELSDTKRAATCIYVVEGEEQAFLPEQIDLAECRRQGYEVREYRFDPSPLCASTGKESGA